MFVLLFIKLVAAAAQGVPNVVGDGGVPVPPPATAATADAGPSATPIPTPAVASYETRVTTAPAISSATSGSVSSSQLSLTLERTPADLFHAVPGFFTAQAQGGAKADQYFLRGFDADHGTDVAFSFDGVPINLPSNGHGQGFTDVHFVLPATVDRIDYSKGPYFAEYGDFDTAGAVDVHTGRDFAQNELSASYGQFETYDVLGVGTTGTGPNAAWIAGEIRGGNGPFDNPEDLRLYSVQAKQNVSLPQGSLAFEALAYGAKWNASGLIPPRALADDQIDVWGAIDPHQGGQTERELAIASWRSDGGALELTAYLAHYQMTLWNDFTFFLYDPVNGDLFEQNDDRLYGGGSARWRHTGFWDDWRFTTKLGAGVRYDAATVSLFHDDSQRQHLPSCLGMPQFCDDAALGLTDFYTYAEEDVRPAPWLRLVLGGRGDFFTWSVQDQRAQPLPGSSPTTGTVASAIANPKLSAVATPLPGWDLYLDGGGGFHSNDARGIIASNGAGALPRAWGAELGTHLSLWNRLDLSGALWFLYLEQEVTFDPDVDGTVPNPPSRRYGVDLSGRWEIWRHRLVADADLMVAHVQFTQAVSGGYDIPLAPTETCTAGLSAFLPWNVHARLAFRQMGDHPATTDGTLIAQGYALFDFTADWRWRFLGLGVSVENVLNSSWREGQYAYYSRLPGEPAQGFDEVDFTPGNPINVLGTVSLYF